VHEGSRAISKELPLARQSGGRGQAGGDGDRALPPSPPQSEGLRSAPRPAPLRWDPRLPGWIRGARPPHPAGGWGRGCSRLSPLPPSRVFGSFLFFLF